MEQIIKAILIEYALVMILILIMIVVYFVMAVNIGRIVRLLRGIEEQQSNINSSLRDLYITIKEGKQDFNKKKD